MNYGFVIDNRSCIGCHACSTACKSENDVPLGVYRTWVKYVETGTWPNPQRHFQVTRCNHCSNPPCARICPTAAMFQRPDGIVEFDSEACIGCKACLQACPYDAIYIDPETKTAAKCHYCAHRTERGLEPACVVVCPTHAIIAGDIDDPLSEISRTLAREKVTVRKPEQGTAPKLFYIEGNAVSMHPTAAASPRRDSFMWAEVVEGAQEVSEAPADHGKQALGLPAAGPIFYGGRQAEHMVQVSYNAQHKVPWHWQVPAYLVTKGVAGGLFIVMALALMMGVAIDSTTALAAAATSLVMLTATTALLVGDLEQPKRFLYILLRPQWRSWLTRGAVVLIAASALAAAWVLVEAAPIFGLIGADTAAAIRPWLYGLGAVSGAATAVYTAFLFGQAEGRDLWQNQALPIHLLVQAVMAGSAALLIAAPLTGASAPLTDFFFTTFMTAVVLDLGILFLAEMAMPHASEIAAKAAHAIHSGRYRVLFWVGAIALGHAAPLLLGLALPSLMPLGALLALFGLYCYEHAFVMAPQEVPNS